MSFDVEPGEVFAIIGPNGAGKSTIFNLISRLYEPSSGSMHYGEHDLRSLRAHEIVGAGIARTFQNIELFEQATVLQNLLVGRHSRMKHNPFSQFLFLPRERRSEIEHRRKVEDIIDLLEIAQYRDERIADLPYGARKNVELARALCAEPTLLLLDEPASGLNNEETDDMSFWLEDIRHDLGVTLVMVEHDMNLVGQVADRVMAINDGCMLAIGTPDQVRNDAAVQRADTLIELARKESSPDITVGLTYMAVGKRSDELAQVAPPADDGRDILGVNLSLNLPLWRGRTRAAVAEASERRLDAVARRRDVRASIERSLGELAEQEHA